MSAQNTDRTRPPKAETRHYGLATAGTLATGVLLVALFGVAEFATNDKPAERPRRASDIATAPVATADQPGVSASVALEQKLAIDREMSQPDSTSVDRGGVQDMPVVARPHSSGQVQAQIGWVEPQQVDVKLLAEPPEFDPVLREMVQRACEAELLRGPPLPVTGAVDEALPTSLPTEPGGPPGQTRAPGDFVFYVNQPVTPVGASTSVVAEPSVANNDRIIFQSGNWYAAISYNDGNTWQHVDPYNSFPQVDGGFCCDQIVIYDASRDAMYWLLQYVHDGSTNTHRFAVATGVSALENLNWCVYDFNPQDDVGIPANHWFDFPDLVLGNNSLYWTTNVFTTQTFCSGGQSDGNSCASSANCGGFPCRVRWLTAIIARLPLDEMSQCASFGYGFWNQLDFDPADRSFGWRACHGTGSTIYWAAHISTSSIRIFRWEEGTDSITFDDVNHGAFSWDLNNMTCPGPDGNDSCARADTRILGAYNANNVLGFMWVSAAHGPFPRPYVQIAQFRESDRALIADHQIWSATTAWTYPSVGVNARDHLAGTIFAAGDNSHPMAKAWIADDISPSGSGIAPLENYTARFSTDGPASNKWGDYLTARPHSRFSNTWIGSGFTLQGGPANGDTEPRHMWFGRERDTPPARPSNDDCEGAFGIFSWPYSSNINTEGATNQGSDPVPGCGVDQNSNTVWYRFTAPCDGVIDVDTCDSSYDTVLSVSVGQCGGLGPIDCLDDGGCPEMFQSALVGVPVVGGLTYYIEVSDFNLPGGGDLHFHFDYTGDSVPPNDDCTSAAFVGVPSITPGTTICADVDSDAPFCGAGATSPGLWYRVRGTGNTMTATTCNAGTDTDYDTKISVYCDNCDNLTTEDCVVGNDDNCTAFFEFHSTVTWCSQFGADYLILVHGFGGDSGDFVLDLFDDGTPCTGAVDCGGDPIGGCCVHGAGTCMPGLCGVFESCGGNCLCALSSAGNGFCASGFQFCDGLTPCPNGASDCPAGTFCWVGSCCGGPVCASPCLGEGKDAGTVDERLSLAELDRTPMGSAPVAIDKGTGSTACLEIPRTICDDADGIYQGDGVSCGQDTCVAACCVNGACIGVIEELACEVQGGTWSYGDDCTSVTCPEATGACCPGEACSDTFLCDAPPGAQFSCNGTLGCVCADRVGGGTTCINAFQGCGDACPNGDIDCLPGSVCVRGGCCNNGAPVCVLDGCPLPVPPGRTLEPGEVGITGVFSPELIERGEGMQPGCLEIEGPLCEMLGGMYEGDLSVCLDTVCPAPEACCFSDGGCLDALVDECLALGGTPRGPSTLCSQTTCGSETGACCAPHTCTDGFSCGVQEFFPCDGTFNCTCITTTEGGFDCVHVEQQNPPTCRGTADCAPGTVCVANLCNEMVVCLLKCSEPQPPRGSWDPDALAIFGDAVMDGSSRGIGGTAECNDTTALICQDVSGFFQGLGTTCANTSCPDLIGACCINGECIGNTEQIPCLKVGGEWFEGDDCHNFVCPTLTQACCSPEGRECIDEVPNVCLIVGGTPQGPGTRCLGDQNNNGFDDACETQPPCAECGPGDHWIDECRSGTDQMNTGALIGIDVTGDCVQDTTVRLNGPINVGRSGPLDDSLEFPGLAPLDQHDEVLDTEILSLHLSGGGMTMVAGGGLGQGGVLRRSLGAIVEQPTEPRLGDSFFDVFFEFDLGGGNYVYNHTPLRVVSKIECIPPDTTYIHPFDCIPLYDSPFPGAGTVVARLVRANHTTNPDCGDPSTGDCFDPGNGSPHCDNETCCLNVCEAAPPCCDEAWGPECASIAGQICLEACCVPDGRCDEMPPEVCRDKFGGEPQGPGTRCQGDINGNNIDDACEFDEPCEVCGPGEHWVDECRAGVDNMPSEALIGIDLTLNCEPNSNLRLLGPVTVQRSSPRDDSVNFPGTRPIDGHFDVLDTEILLMVLTRSGITLRAGAGQGQGGVLWPSYGVIAEQSGDNTMADSSFEVFFEVDLGGGNYAYNHQPLRVDSKINCLPPDTTYIHPSDCIPLFDVPPRSPIKPTLVANLITADHSTYPARIVHANPQNEGSLWRSEHNIVRIEFDDDITQPTSGQIRIREMLPGGLFGLDLSGAFLFDVENNGGGQPRILRIWEDVLNTLEHRKWYSVANLGGWAGVSPFDLLYVVQVGDANDDGRVLAFDVSVINTGIPNFAAHDDERRDINGDSRVLAFDVSVTNGSIPSFNVPKPSGHP